MDKFKTIPITPLTGLLDSRSASDSEPSGAFAAKQNFEISPDGKLRQCGGFAKPFDVYRVTQNADGTTTQCPYANWDWHDQGAGVTVDERMPITLLYPFTSNSQVRKLYAATKNEFLLLNEQSGLWTTIGTGFGADGSDLQVNIRFMAADLQNLMYLTNGYDPVQCHDTSTTTMQPIPALATAGTGGVAISKARVVIQYSGVVMLMNMYEGSTQFASRIRWSDLNNGLNWGAGTASISDYQDLDYGETILNAIPLLGNLYIFTDRSIWRCTFTTTISGYTTDTPPVAIYQATLNCQRIYSEPRNKSKCLAFPLTLVSTGLDLYYAGTDAIYHYNPYLAEPERLEWIYRATDIIFDTGNIQIDRYSCNSAVAEYWPDRKEIHFTWPEVDAEPTSAIVANCQTVPAQTDSSGLNRNTLVINTEYKTCDYRDYGTVCFVNYRSDLYASGGCNQSVMFMGVSSADYCIKQFGQGFSREVYDPMAETFSMTGYYCVLRGVLPIGQFNTEKVVKKFALDGVADGNNGTVFHFRIGTSYTALNPNAAVGNCEVLWKALTDKPVACLMTKTAAQYAASNTRPSTDVHWDFLYRGRFLYYELTIQNADGSPASAGGVFLSRFEITVNAP